MRLAALFHACGQFVPTGFNLITSLMHGTWLLFRFFMLGLGSAVTFWRICGKRRYGSHQVTGDNANKYFFHVASLLFEWMSLETMTMPTSHWLQSGL